MTDMLCAIRMLLIVESIVLVSAKSAHVNLVELAIVPHYTIAYLFLKYVCVFSGRQQLTSRGTAGHWQSHSLRRLR